MIIIDYNLFIIKLTWTDHWCILTVATVMHTPWTMSTILNGSFIPLTLNFVQPNLSTSLEHWQQSTNTQVDDRQPPHLLYPSYRHKPFPSYLCNRPPLCPLRTNFLQPISHLTYKKLRFIYWFYGSKLTPFKRLYSREKVIMNLKEPTYEYCKLYTCMHNYILASHHLNTP